MSATELRDAARWLRKISETATPGPWDTEVEPRHIRGNDGRNYVTDTSEGVNDYENARYIATMHPGVALALADWLDAMAVSVEVGTWPPGMAGLDVARLINGGAA